MISIQNMNTIYLPNKISIKRAIMLIQQNFSRGVKDTINKTPCELKKN